MEAENFCGVYPRAFTHLSFEDQYEEALTFTQGTIQHYADLLSSKLGEVPFTTFSIIEGVVAQCIHSMQAERNLPLATLLLAELDDVNLPNPLRNSVLRGKMALTSAIREHLQASHAAFIEDLDLLAELEGSPHGSSCISYLAQLMTLAKPAEEESLEELASSWMMSFVQAVQQNPSRQQRYMHCSVSF